MRPKPTLSVILPTYNCVGLMERHLASMVGWLDLADEVIVVDSRSTDGTIELIRERLRHPGLRIIERDRGLYESWNEGIAATKGEWIYVSTAGDTIERDHLLHLLEIGENGQADVVISPPFFVDEDGAPCKDPGWPPRKIVEASGLKTPFSLTSSASFLLAFLHFPCAILGSSASNLYRGAHLRERPFPTDFKGAGDSVWILRHAAHSRLFFTPNIGSTFCMHPREKPDAEALLELNAKFLHQKAQSLQTPGFDVSDKWLRILLSEHHLLIQEVRGISQERRNIWRARPLGISGLYSWLKVSVAYLRKRNQMKSRYRHIMDFLGVSSFLPVRLTSRKKS